MLTTGPRNVEAGRGGCVRMCAFLPSRLLPCTRAAARSSLLGCAFTGCNLEFKQPSCADTRKNHTTHLTAPVAQRRQAWHQWPDVKQAEDRVERVTHRGSQRLCVLMRILLRTGMRRPTVRRPRPGPAPANGESA